MAAHIWFSDTVPMQIDQTAIPGVVLLTPKRHGDARGWFSETYNQDRFDAALGQSIAFCQDNQVFSPEVGTLRGLHYQAPPAAQAKLVRCLRGAILDVVVDIRVGSPTYGQHVAAELSAENGRQIFVPRGFAHGYATLMENCEVAYKVDNRYSPEAEGGVLWSDPALGIDWRIDTSKAIVKDADRHHPLLADLAPVFTYGDDL